MEARQIGELINQATAPALTEPKLLKTGELANLERALQTCLIADSTLQEISQVLRLVMMKVGIRAANLPSEVETIVLFDHIKENFGGNRIAEIKLAFDMALGEKLDLEPKEISCYENFSCAYFSKIMNAYRKWSKDEARAIIREIPPEQKLYSDNELDDQQRGDIEAFYQRLLKGQIPYRIPEYFKGMLVKDGLMKQEDYIENFLSHRLNNGFKNIYVRE